MRNNYTNKPIDPKNKRELIVITKKEYGIRSLNNTMKSVRNKDISNLNKLLRDENIEMLPLYFDNDNQTKRLIADIEPDARDDTTDLANYYYIPAPEERVDELVTQLNDQDEVEVAYVKPRAELPLERIILENRSERSNLPLFLPDQLSDTTPHFINRQIYLNPAPEGVDAYYAWKVPGGTGNGIRIIDLEAGWNFNHQDLKENQGGVISGINWEYDYHGTSVIGIISGDKNSFGITGISPDANISAVSIYQNPEIPTSRAITIAANKLGKGDIILLEMHRPGPRHNFQERSDQEGYIGIEWWPDDFKAVQYAVNRGIIVVEAAGNGGENLDDDIYSINPAAPEGPFPSWWKNPFKRNPLDSGALIVGAAAPPPGTHEQNHGPDRSRLGFSNFGNCVDTQGWGREVTTTGGRSPPDSGIPDLNDLFAGDGPNQWYTDIFAGTSSASPIVTGVVACIQGIVRAKDKDPINPFKMRDILRNTGSPQQQAPGRPVSQRIGNRPNLKQIIEEEEL
jgi:subtilisin family serine protease